jgi:tetratricopeptide (TPR) repeat protein
VLALNEGAMQFYGEAQYAWALQCARDAVALARQHLRADDLDLAACLNNLALIQVAVGDYAAAEPLYQEAIAICGKVSAPAQRTATYLSNLGNLYTTTGRLDDAGRAHSQALDLRQRACGDDHVDVAQSLHNLAALYRGQGDYARAEECGRRSLEILSSHLGEQNLDVASSLNNLGTLYSDAGDYAQAETMLQKALKVRRALVGPNHPLVATSLENLGGLYDRMDDLDRAEEMIRKAYEIRLAFFGEQHPEVAASLHNLSAICSCQGNYDEALELAHRAYDIRSAVLGKYHPDLALSFNQLAGLYVLLGNYKLAEGALGAALKIRRAVSGDHHPDAAVCLSNLASLAQDRGDMRTAERLYRQALDIRREALGESHPDYALTLMSLASVLVSAGRADEALQLMAEAMGIEQAFIAQVFALSSETQRITFLQRLWGKVDVFLSLVNDHLAGNAAVVAMALDVVLRRKALAEEASREGHYALLSGRYPEVADKLGQLWQLRAQIARKTLDGPGPEGAAEHEEHLAAWRREQEQLERDLARKIPEVGLEQQLQTCDRQSVAQSLPPGCVLIEFIRFRPFDFGARAEPIDEKTWRPPDCWQPPRYLALVLHANDPDNPAMIDMGDAASIDGFVAQFRRALTEEQPTAAADELGLELRAAVFDALLPALGDCRRLFIAPDGDLNRLPFEVLPLDDLARVIDEYQISYVAVGRDVLRFARGSVGEPLEPLVIADPDYDLAAEQATGSDTRQSRDLRQSIHRFPPLPGTRLEGQFIADLLGVEPCVGTAAREAVIKDHPSPRILHLATHGFFLEDQPLATQGDPTVRIVGALPSRLDAARLENPLLRSGLALAGANAWLDSLDTPADCEDGLLTAADVEGLDLLDTELVVLSACETGLGDIQVGEGVLGLRRAFMVAGVETLVMSLWSVPDLATAVLMQRFYTNLLHRVMGRREALREAQFFTRDATIADLRATWLSAEVMQRVAQLDRRLFRHMQYLAQQPDDHRPFYHPLNWGAFICQGKTEPLGSRLLRS